MQPTSAPPPELSTLLRGVSRSFDLSIRLLPRGMREPVGVGYLLARATDTIADATALDTPDRLAALDALDAACTSGASFLLDARVVAAAGDPDEAALLRALPACLDALRALPGPDRADVRAVLDSIVTGQRMDLERFGTGGPLRALSTSAEVAAYTQLVAGCVGEFWTAVGTRHVQRFASLPANELLRLGRAYGQALQRLNILRDARDDLAAGRCYFPLEELAPVGLAPGDIAQAPPAFGTLWARWLQQIEAGLRDGIRYALAVHDARMRAATALPALLGARTVTLLRAAGPRALRERVKMPRAEVRRLLASLALHLAGRAHIERAFARLLAGGVPAQWDNAAP